MKCQRCPKQATLHITEVLEDDKFTELHLCEECSKQYLYSSEQPTNSITPTTKTAAVAEDLSSKNCDVCGIKFIEFRNHGRLGCAHDYDVFREELVTLLENIHGDTKHQGKTPKKKPKPGASPRELSTLRKKLQQAVADEAYEEAARIRDRLKELED